MSRVYLSLGTNVGERRENLRLAIRALEPDVHVLRVSPVYETEPWGYTDQPYFLNQVIEAETELTPDELLATLKDLELQLGRQPSIRYGPRVIDLDILFYDNFVLITPKLTIPHAHLHERAFVLKPLADLAPQFRHPVLGMSVSEMLENVDTSGVEVFQDPA